ncbi:MAG: ligase-associated DNA damage response endonuclease PdeM [Phycisphaeraceae bacterium]
MPFASGTLEIKLADETVRLDPRRALVWPASKTVVIADPHIGKDDTFRRAGIPVPANVAAADFDRLSQLVTDHDAERLVVLGDFLHARLDADDHCVGLLRAWRSRFGALQVVIVRGNHDAHAGPPPDDLGLASVDEPMSDGPFVYRHFPLPTDAGRDTGFVLAGHLHPGVTVALGGRGARRVACFHATRTQMILPAFGAFTGTARVARDAGGSVYAVGRDRVIELPGTAVV